jgi:CubicO group peptidase (beta-lactamase class C family)
VITTTPPLRGLTVFQPLVVLLALTALLTPNAAAREGPLDPETLVALVDDVMADHFERFALAGASVAIVHGGDVVLSRGYGHADLATGRRVDPDTTLFATGSVAKLFTWMALMQLVEAGRVDLDADVNTYLRSLRVPATFAEPVRIWHLLSHTAGFEDKPVVGLFSRSAENLPTLEEALARALPARVAEPGVFTAYSNYGTALAAQVVADVTGMPWETYVETHVFGPLGMQHATVRQPIPPHLRGDITRVYRAAGDEPVEAPFEFVPLAPAGGMAVSTGDMARFMLAHLQGGRLGEARVLDEATVRQMHTQLFTHDARLPGNAYGFWEGEANGQRFIGHGGDTMLSHTMLALLPEHDVGFYVAYNSAEGAAARAELWQAFLDHAFPVEPLEPVEAPAHLAVGEGLDHFAGSYGVNRISTTTIGKLGALLGSLSIVADGGHLTVAGMTTEPSRFVATGPGEFVQVDGDRRLLFREDAHGRVTHVFLSDAPMLVGVRTEWHATLALQATVFLGSLLVVLSALVGWPLDALVRRRRRAARAPRSERLARWWAAAAGILLIAFFATFALALPNPLDIVYGMTPLLAAALVIGVAAAVLSAGTAGLAALAWRRGYWGRSARIHFTLVALAGLALVWQLDYWNLLGIRV